MLYLSKDASRVLLPYIQLLCCIIKAVFTIASSVFLAFFNALQSFHNREWRDFTTIPHVL